MCLRAKDLFEPAEMGDLNRSICARIHVQTPAGMMGYR
jgi:hypothetical protein